MDALITYYGNAVKLSNFVPDTIRVDMDGFLKSFTLRSDNTKYKYYHKSYFNTKTKFVKSGYYKVEDLQHNSMYNGGEYSTLKVMARKLEMDTLSEAELNDQIIVEIFNPDEPELFYSVKRYTFNHQLDNQYITGGKMNTSIMGTSDPVTINTNPIGKLFYTNHIILVDEHNDPDRKFSTLLAKTALRIGMIDNEVFEALKDAGSGIDLTLIYQFIASIESEWSTNMYFNEPDINGLTEMKYALDALYRGGHKYELNIKMTSIVGNRLFTFFKFLSKDSLETLISIDTILDIATALVKNIKVTVEDRKEIVKKKEVIFQKVTVEEKEEAFQREIVYLVDLVKESDADTFLEYLLVKEDGKVTNYEILYKTVTDDWDSRTPIVSWFSENEKPNRGLFVYSVYKLWLVSKFNIYYLPQNANPVDLNINPNSYFFNQGIDYFENNDPVLEFHDEDDGDGYQHFYSTKLINGHIRVVEAKYPEHLDDDGIFVFNETNTTFKENNFHLFQQLNLIGYTPSLEIKFPSNLTPAFFYYYAKEYKLFQFSTASLNLFFELGVEIILFLGTGGLGALRHLRHLKHYRLIGKAMLNNLSPAVSMQVWTGYSALGEVLTLSSSILYSHANYVANTTDNQQTHDSAVALGNFFLALTFVNGFGTALSRKVALKKGDELLDEIAKLPNGVDPNIDQTVLTLLQNIKGSKTVSLALFKQKFIGPNLTIPANGINHIVSKYDAFTDILKSDFYDSFKDIDNVQDWLRLNENSGAAVENWKNLNALKALDRNNLDIITNQNISDKLVSVLAKSKIKVRLEKLSIAKRLKLTEVLDTADASLLTRIDECEDDLIFSMSKLSKSELDHVSLSLSNLKIYINAEIHKLRAIRPYVYPGNSPFLNNSFILNKYDQAGLTLVNHVHSKALVWTGNEKNRRVLFAAMIDKSTGYLTDIYSNYRINKKAYGTISVDYDTYFSNLHPNLKDRVNSIINSKVDNKKKAIFAGGGHPPVNKDIIASHGEVQALNELAKQKFPSGAVSDDVFENWLKNDVLAYNKKFAGVDEIMICCTECSILTDLITFIK